MIITATVIVTYPPSSSEIPIPIAVVMDLGNNVTYSSWPKLNIKANANIQTKLVSTPEIMPANIATTFSLSNLICWYKGIARHTVAGVKR